MVLFIPFKKMGIPDEYTITGSQAEILAHYGIIPEGISEQAFKLLKK
jgi:transketolase